MTGNGHKSDLEDRRALPGLLSVLQLCQLTGKKREVVIKRIDKLSSAPGSKGANLYDPKLALPLIYRDGEPSSPQDALAVARKEQIGLEMEIARKERPKRADMLHDFSLTCGRMADIIRSSPKLPDDSRTDLLTSLREFLDRCETE